jgi:ubiquinone/menaquinone biosynthesis C-methylase UbiE
MRNITADAAYVQFGCAYNAPKEWLNFDVSLTLRTERIPVVGRLVRKNDIRFPNNAMYGDISRGLPVSDESCAGVYACHVLEHMTLDETQRALRNTFRMLRAGGLFRVVVPDLRVIASRYLEGGSPSAAHEFMRACLVGVERRPATFLGLVAHALGRSMHLWMWDYESLSLELRNAGFEHVRRCSFNDSADSMFRLVEDFSRFQDAVAVECKK